MGLAKKLWTAQKQSPGNFLGLYKQININREKRINKTINVFFCTKYKPYKNNYFRITKYQIIDGQLFRSENCMFPFR